MAMFLLFFIVFTLVETSILAAPFDHLWQVKRTSDSNDAIVRCNFMKDAVGAFMDDVIAIASHPDYDGILPIPNPGQISADQLKQKKAMVLPYACIFANVDSLESLARVANRSLSMIKSRYEYEMESAQRIGGNPYEISKMHVEMSEALLQALKFHGFPTWPLQGVSKKGLVQVMENLPNVYGNNWLRIMFMSSYIPTADEFDTTDIERFAKSFTEATSNHEAAQAIHTLITTDFYPESLSFIKYLIDVLEIQASNGGMGALFKQAFKDGIYVLKLAETYGLFDLN